MIRLLIIGMPGTPVYEIGQKISEFHEIDFITLERLPEEMDSYWDDKIPEMRMDTGDMGSGSESQQYARDPMAEEKDKVLDSVSVDPASSLSDEEKLEVFSVPQGILASEIPDEALVRWSTDVLFLDADDEEAVSWFKKRRKCPTCNTVFHIEDKPPTIPGICDRCGTDLKRKKEDHPKTIRKQYHVWREDFRESLELARQDSRFLKIHVLNYESLDKMVLRVEKWLKKGRDTRRVNWSYR